MREKRVSLERPLPTHVGSCQQKLHMSRWISRRWEVGRRKYSDLLQTNLQKERMTDSHVKHLN